MYLTTAAGGVGITLTRASHVIITDPAWNPVADIQAVSRAWRFGQTRTVEVYRLIAQGTLEERIYRLCVQKHALASRILEETDINRFFTREDLKSLTDDEKCVPLNTLDIAKSSTLSAFVQMIGYTIYSHDDLFIGNEARLSQEDELLALNDLNGVLAQQPRNLLDQQGELQTVAVGQMRFKTIDDEEGPLVAAYTPYFSEVHDRIIVFQNLGPSYFFEMEFYEGSAPTMTMSVISSGAVMYAQVPAAGTWLFRVRSIDDEQSKGPWSEESIPILVAS
jgi:hypothetical protein